MNSEVIRMKEETFRKKFGKRLKSLRERAGLSQIDLRDRIYAKSGIDISANRLSNWELGFGLPSIAFVKAICASLNCTLEEFFDAQSSEITPEEFKLIMNYRELDDAGRHTVEAVIDSQLIRLSTTAKE